MNLSPLYSSDDRSLPAELNVVSGYVLPVLMGLLGSMTYVLRRYLRSVGDRLLTPRDLREYIVRLVLGTVFGVTIGFFTTAENVHRQSRQLPRRTGACVPRRLRRRGRVPLAGWLGGPVLPRAKVKWCKPAKQ